MQRSQFEDNNSSPNLKRKIEEKFSQNAEVQKKPKIDASEISSNASQVSSVIQSASQAEVVGTIPADALQVSDGSQVFNSELIPLINYIQESLLYQLYLLQKESISASAVVPEVTSAVPGVSIAVAVPVPAMSPSMHVENKAEELTKKSKANEKIVKNAKKPLFHEETGLPAPEGIVEGSDQFVTKEAYIATKAWKATMEHARKEGVMASYDASKLLVKRGKPLEILPQGTKKDDTNEFLCNRMRKEERIKHNNQLAALKPSDVSSFSPADLEQKSVKSKQKSVKSKQKPVKLKQKSVKSKQKPVKLKQKSVKSKQKPVKSKQKSESVKSKQKPVKLKQQPVSISKNSNSFFNGDAKHQSVPGVLSSPDLNPLNLENRNVVPQLPLPDLSGDSLLMSDIFTEPGDLNFDFGLESLGAPQQPNYLAVTPEDLGLGLTKLEIPQSNFLSMEEDESEDFVLRALASPK